MKGCQTRGGVSDQFSVAEKKLGETREPKHEYAWGVEPKGGMASKPRESENCEVGPSNEIVLGGKKTVRGVSCESGVDKKSNSQGRDWEGGRQLPTGDEKEKGDLRHKKKS